MFEIETSEENVEDNFHRNFETKNISNNDFYISKTGPMKGTVVFKHDGPGLWSNIEILLAVKENRDELYKLRVVSQAETPGLGARIVEDWFLANFEGAHIRPEIRLVKLASKPNEVDAVSGATNTSNFLQDIINKGIIKMDELLKEVN